MGSTPQLKVVKIRRRKGDWKADTCNPAAGDSVQWKNKDPDIATFTVFFPREEVFGTRIIEGENGETQPVQLAAAATMPKGYNTRWLRRGLAELERPQHTGGLLKTQLYVEPGEKHDTVLLGLNIDPREVFSKRAGPGPTRTNPLAFDLDIPALVHRFPERAAPRAPAYTVTLGRLRAWGRHAGRALVGELTLGLKGAPPITAGRLPDYTGMDWPSPGLAEARSKGARCLRQYTRGMIEAFRALVAEAKRHFGRAAELDPSEAYASYYAFFLGDNSDRADREPAE